MIARLNRIKAELYYDATVESNRVTIHGPFHPGSDGSVPIGLSKPARWQVAGTLCDLLRPHFSIWLAIEQLRWIHS